MDLHFRVAASIKLDCIDCDLFDRRSRGSRCSDCMFIIHGNKVKYTAARNGISEIHLIDKHYLFYYLFHPELRWQMPDGKWELHHKDENHWNDHPSNHELLLPEAHRRLHRNLAKHVLQKVSDGTYVSPWTGDNGVVKVFTHGTPEDLRSHGHINGGRVANLLEWITATCPGWYPLFRPFITELCNKLGYSGPDQLRAGIRNLIQSRNLKDCFYVNKGGVSRAAENWLVKIGE